MVDDVMIMEKKALLQDRCACELPVQSIDYNVFFIAIVWHLGQGQTEAPELSKVINARQNSSAFQVLSTEHLEVYKHKLADAGLIETIKCRVKHTEMIE